MGIMYLMLLEAILILTVLRLVEYMYYERGMRTKLLCFLHDLCYVDADDDETEE